MRQPEKNQDRRSAAPHAPDNSTRELKAVPACAARSSVPRRSAARTAQRGSPSSISTARDRCWRPDRASHESLSAAPFARQHRLHRPYENEASIEIIDCFGFVLPRSTFNTCIFPYNILLRASRASNFLGHSSLGQLILAMFRASPSRLIQGSNSKVAPRERSLFSCNKIVASLSGPSGTEFRNCRVDIDTSAASFCRRLRSTDIFARKFAANRNEDWPARPIGRDDALDARGADQSELQRLGAQGLKSPRRHRARLLRMQAFAPLGIVVDWNQQADSMHGGERSGQSGCGLRGSWGRCWPAHSRGWP